MWRCRSFPWKEKFYPIFSTVGIWKLNWTVPHRLKTTSQFQAPQNQKSHKEDEDCNRGTTEDRKYLHPIPVTMRGLQSAGLQLLPRGLGTCSSAIPYGSQMNLGWSLPPKEGTKLTQDNRWVLLPSAANSRGCSIPEISPHNITGHWAKLVCSSPPQCEHTEFNPSSGWMPALTCLRPQLFHDRLHINK